MPERLPVGREKYIANVLFQALASDHGSDPNHSGKKYGDQSVYLKSESAYEREWIRYATSHLAGSNTDKTAVTKPEDGAHAPEGPCSNYFLTKQYKEARIAFALPAVPITGTPKQHLGTPLSLNRRGRTEDNGARVTE